MASDFAVVRYLPNGELDPTFGADGKVRTRVTEQEDTMSLAATVDGGDRILVAGRTGEGGNKFAALRYLTNGQLDSAFGRDGKILSPFFEGEGKVTAAAFDFELPIADPGAGGVPAGSVAFAGEVPSDGAALIAGSISPFFLRGGIVVVGSIGDSPSQLEFAVARYLFNGDLDSTFGGDGMVRTSLFENSSEATAVVVDRVPRGILVAGTIIGFLDASSFGIARYLPDGSLDSTFNGDGTNLTSFDEGPSRALGVALNGRGSVVVGVAVGFGVARYNENGQADSNFGERGTSTSFQEGSGGAQAVDSDGRTRIVAVGTVFSDELVDRNLGRFAVARYLLNGELDPDFNQDGKVVTRFEEGESMAFAVKNDVLQERIFVVGKADGQFAMVCYLPNGELDLTFGVNGKVRTVAGEEDEQSEARAVAFDSQGRIIVAGTIFLVPDIL